MHKLTEPGTMGSLMMDVVDVVMCCVGTKLLWIVAWEMKLVTQSKWGIDST